MTTITDSKRFLGREFLTWLWYLSETKNERIRIEDTAEGRTYEVDLWVEDRLVLESKANENILRGEGPSQSAEAQAALIGGKTVKEMKIAFDIKPLGEFSCVLDASALTPRSLKLPTLDQAPEGADPDDTSVIRRMRLTDAFLTVLDGLFGRFLKERLDESWQQAGLKHIQTWIKSRSGSEILH